MVIEILTGVQVLRSLVEMGMSAHAAWKEGSFDKDAVAALGAFHSAAEGFWKLKPQQEEELGALHLSFVARCFGQAISRYQTYSQTLAPTQPELFASVTAPAKQQQPTAEQIEQRLKSAAQVRIDPGSMPVAKPEIDLVESLTGNPLNTPYYRFLWNAFFKPVGGESPLMPLEAGGRLEFERSFVLAWGEALASTSGARLRQYLESLQRDYKPQLIQEVLISDMAGWGSRHTFGNFTRGEPRSGDPLPFMPLEEMYVQPFARGISSPEDSEGPVLERLEQLLQKNKVVIIQADFGMGKSLTSRMLARLRAIKIREADEPSPDLELPVHVRCADDLRSHDLSVQGAVQRARQRQANLLGYPLEFDDKALAFPERYQRVLILLDGLDEVHLGESGLKTLFDNIKDKAKVSERHRFIIFSRPGALPFGRHIQVLDGIPILELCPWNEEQVDDWLGRWRQVNQGQGPTREQINQQGLGELSATPILLLMIAHTWTPVTGGKTVGRAELYERFFQSIARGKHKDDQDKHPAIFEASASLLEHLVSKQLLDKQAKEPDAMLWLMSRVAWEAVRLETRATLAFSEAETVTRRHIENLLIDELKFRSGDTAIVDSVLIGLLLTLQANLHAGSASQILFGHKSFREFLVARYWADRLRALAKDKARQEVVEKDLLGGMLLTHEDESFDFLKEMLNADPKHEWPPGLPFGLSERERSRLFQWADERFNDERLMGKEARPERLRDDMSILLREAALAIGSCLYEEKGMVQKDKRTLRSMFAWTLLTEQVPMIKAPRANLQEALLADLQLDKADLTQADLTQADLTGADLTQADLTGANLCKAKLTGANLTGANLVGADLTSAELISANLISANLSEGNLTNAELAEASFVRANLQRANLYQSDLSEAKLIGAKLNEANLSIANLTDANLTNANLEGADLTKANCNGANFGGANLIKADFRGANLRGANFRGANLEGTYMNDACYDDQTDWGGNAVAAGTIFVSDQEEDEDDV
jgi:uncharacterized protein YjbI with pentapeptide repeats